MHKDLISKFYNFCGREYFKSTKTKIPYSEKEIVKEFFNNKLKFEKTKISYYFSKQFIKKVAKKTMPKTYYRLKKIIKNE